MKKTVVTMLIVASLVLMPVLAVLALQSDSVPVDVSPYNDTNAQVWGNYIVWRRFNNDDEYNQYADWGDEPSWIMVHNIVTGETWNITPANVMNEHESYEWAESPSIWNGHIIYEYTVGGDSNEQKVFMYNISTGETWDVPIPISYQAGQLCRIHGDWIMTTDYDDGRRQLYLYNYVTTEFKTLISDAQPETTGDVTAYGDFYIFDRYNPSTLVHQICIFNVSSYQMLFLDATDVGINNLRLADCYEEKLLIFALEVTPTSSWNEYIYDFSSVDWTSFGATTIYYWNTHIYANLIPIDRDFTTDAQGGAIWGEWVVYADYPGIVGSVSPNVRAVNYVSNTTMNLTYNVYFQYPTDMYLDKVVFMDNKNSDTNYGDQRDDFDVYRLTTDVEAMSSSIWALLPLIMVAMAAIAIGAAAKVMGGGGRW